MDRAFLDNLGRETEALHDAGLFKAERIITSAQQAEISVGGGTVLNFCANNYLGLSNHPVLRKAAKEAIDKYGYGMSSVRFICGTQDIHKELEARLTNFLKTEDTILYPSAFDANGGLFETILGPDDAIISDQLNHASIIDGIRLSKSKRFRYANSDMADLEAKLKEADASGAKAKLIVTDGVFSMDGYVANLQAICDLAEKYNAMTMIDDCHSTGFVGEKGRGTAEHCGVLGRIDIITGTLGKALGGASGGFTSGRKEIVGWLRQRSRPYLFSNTVAPVIAYTSIRALDLLESSDDLRVKLRENTAYFRSEMGKLGFEILPGEHPIVPVMLGDAKLATEMADKLLSEGIYVIGFCYPVVPKGAARIRTQISAGHDKGHLDKAIAGFAKVGRELGVIS
jgi:glycine C-acetyltransferase